MPTIRTRNGKFQAQVRVKHDGVIVHQESATFETEKQAMRWGLNLEDKIAREGYAARKQDSVTVLDLMTKHERYLTKLGKPTVAIFGRYKNLRDAKFVAKSAAKVTSSDLIEWAADFREGGTKGRSPATVLLHLMALSALFRAGPVAHGVQSDVRVVAAAINHLKQLGVASVSTERTRRVSDEEIDKIAKYHANLMDPEIPLGTIMRLLVALPRRRTEMLTARWENYDPEAHTLKLVDTKNPTKPRTEIVPVPPLAQAIIDALPRKGELILPYKPASVSSAMSRAATMCGIEGLHLHDLRHEGISRLFSLGLRIEHVAEISGHLSWATLRRYTHLTAKDVLDQF
jgi:integrase